MPISNISFGSVVVVWGKPKKVDKVHDKMLPYAKEGKVLIKDVTSNYRYSSPYNVLGNCVQNENGKVDIFITGDDIQKIKDKKRGWDTIQGVLSHMNVFCDLNEMPVRKAIQTIMEQ